MKLSICFLIFVFMQIAYGQNNSRYRVIASTTGSSGSSKTITTSNGTYKVSQSIGQSSVIGTYQSNGYYLRQGYQQPIDLRGSNNSNSSILLATVFPNPFDRQFNIIFIKPVQNSVHISLFDLNGRLIFQNVSQAQQQIRLELNDISSGTYFLKVVSDRKYFNTKLIKF